MSDRKLILRPHIENRDQSVSQFRYQIVSRYGLQRIASAEVVCQDAANLRDIPLTYAAERSDQAYNLGIAGEPIEHMLAAPLRIDEARPPQDLQVARRVGKAQMGSGGELLDTALALGEVLEQVESVRVTKCLRY